MEHTTEFQSPRADTLGSIALRWLATAALVGLVAACSDENAPAAAEESVAEALDQAAAEERPEALGTIAPTPSIESPVAEAPAPPAEDEARDTDPVDGLDARRVALTRGIEDREPVEAATTFEALDEPLFAFFELTNREGIEGREPLVVFVGPDGQERGLIELSVPACAPRWRTWAYSRHIQLPGEWRVELRDEEGRVIAEQEFTVE